MAEEFDHELDETIDFKRLFATLQRWAWLLIAAVVVGALTAYIVSSFQTPIYEASTKILVTRNTSQQQSVDLSQQLTITQLMETYVSLLSMDEFLEQVGANLNHEVNKGSVTVSALQNTQIIDLKVQDKDPTDAERIADTMVQLLIEQNETLQSGRYADAEAGTLKQIGELDTQLTDLQTELDAAYKQAFEAQVKNMEDKIAEAQGELARLNEEKNASAPQEAARRDQITARIAELESLLDSYKQIYNELTLTGKLQGEDEQVTRLEKKFNLYQQVYLNMLGNLEAVRLARTQNMPNVVQVNPAHAGKDPVRPRTLLNTLLGAIAGLILAGGSVAIRELTDDTLKSREEVEKALKANVVGQIAVMDEGEEQKGIFVARQPRSPIAEAFRSLRTGLEFSGVDKQVRVILVTSSGSGEGKTTVAANLAAILAQSGKKVALIDADLRRPRIHKYVGLNNRLGLSDMFRDGQQKNSARYLQEIKDIPELSIMSSGKLPPNPAELLGSEKMKHIIDNLLKVYGYVVLDSPPFLVTDPQVLASRVDGVLLVVVPGYTRADAAKSAAEQIQRAGGRLLGVVLNRVQPGHRAGYYNTGYGYHQYHYQYSYYDYSSDTEANGNGNGTGKKNGKWSFIPEWLAGRSKRRRKKVRLPKEE